MSKEREQAWRDGFQAGIKEVKSMLEIAINSPDNTSNDGWIKEFISKLEKISE
jgi:hypothetical protein